MSNAADFLELRGNTLELEDVERVARHGQHVGLAKDALKNVEAARAYVDKVVSNGDVVYGLTTGFGALSEVTIKPDRIRELQLNLIRSHAAGVGEPLPDEEVRAIMLLRANVLALGHSGVRPVVINQLTSLLNKNIHPVIPSKGSVGASGDLAPLSHLALVLLGEGEARVDGVCMNGADALAKAGLKKLVLEAKEGLALNNGTQVMTGIGILALLDAERAVEIAEVAGAMSLEGLKGTPVAFDERIHRARPQPGQLTSAQRLRTLLDNSEIRESHRHGDPRVQDAYSLRCMPQVHGAARQALAYVRGVLEIEANSATDNPLIFADDEAVLSGGNFHGQPVSQALDLLAIAIADLGSICERRIARLVDPGLSALPAFLTKDPGVNSGMMMAQIVAAALVADMRHKAHVVSTDSIPTDANKEDHVSMGVHAAIKARETVRIMESLLAIELMTAAQALEFHKPLKPGAGVEKAYNMIRERVPALEEDRVLAGDIRQIEMLVRSGELAEIWRTA